MPEPVERPREHPRTEPWARRGRIGHTDVTAVVDFTGRLRRLDYRHGGGRCRDAAVARLPAARALLGLHVADDVLGPLCTAVADLHNLAGWACFDTGAVDEALVHFGVALEVAALGGDRVLLSNIHYRRGRVRLHHDSPEQALAEFRLGERAAGAGGSALALAVTGANQAWARARLGDEGAALALLAGARDDFAGARGEPVPAWAAFFTAADLSAMTGVVHTELARSVDPRHVESAVPALVAALDGYGPDMARSRAFTLISLATCLLIDEQVERAVAVGEQVLDLCRGLASVRTAARLRPLRDEAARRRGDADARALARRISAFRPEAGPV
ncbi:putative regulatory protein [Actinokineospora spheciospongiae]|uniref:Putative regulatory protein n=1 Tax=Actinokineospora spheciospongiae TaxID=909613 RepID=W7J2W4_9PSEU|nr:hypothetical protein [Actinokineospora spheciospongiae]EWC60474.1 putative regulatory protein [Actinokineospora spheciospongiae]